jgi:hypothetical protein
MILAAFGKVGTMQHVRRVTLPARTPELVSVFAAIVGMFWRDIRHGRSFDERPAASVFLSERAVWVWSIIHAIRDFE